MAISYQYQIKGETLIVSAFGQDDSLDQVENHSEEILHLALENNCTKILSDERQLKYSISIIETFELGKLTADKGKILEKIAIVCSVNDYETAQFFENVSANRGLNIFVTTYYDRAVEWLK